MLFKNAILALSCVLTLACSSLAPCYASADTLSVSVVDHPAVRTMYWPIVKAMYQRAGIKVSWQLINNSPRSLKGLENGLFDADIGKILPSIKGYHNIVHVPTPIADTALFLLCRKQIICNRSVLNNVNANIASPYSKEIIAKVVPINAHVVTLTANTKALALLKLGRIDYVILGDDANRDMGQLSADFQRSTLASAKLYHILNKKYQHLIPILDKALQQVLAEQH